MRKIMLLAVLVIIAPFHAFAKNGPTEAELLEYCHAETGGEQSRLMKALRMKGPLCTEYKGNPMENPSYKAKSDAAETACYKKFGVDKNSHRGYDKDISCCIISLIGTAAPCLVVEPPPWYNGHQ